MSIQDRTGNGAQQLCHNIEASSCKVGVTAESLCQRQDCAHGPVRHSASELGIRMTAFDGCNETSKRCYEL